ALNSSETDIGKAAALFPLIGVIVGGGTALVFVGMQRILPLPASVFCAIGFATLITNGFHEDGLADSFDGFGGGWTKDRVLEIMIGTVTLLLVFILLPWQAVLAALLLTTLVTLLSGLYFRARLQGITGDCLGAANQLTEVGLYVTAVVLLRFNFLR